MSNREIKVKFGWALLFVQATRFANDVDDDLRNSRDKEAEKILLLESAHDTDEYVYGYNESNDDKEYQRRLDLDLPLSNGFSCHIGRIRFFKFLKALETDLLDQLELSSFKCSFYLIWRQCLFCWL